MIQQIFRALIITLAFSALAAAQIAEQKAARYLESIRKQPPLVLAFLRAMPKGGDLHVHLTGATWAEDMIDWAVTDNLCVERTSSRLLPGPCDSCEKYTPKPAAACAHDDHVLYNQIVDAWSMRNWHAGDESGHDHFFATFDKFGLATHNHLAEAIATVANRAAHENLQYMELMNTADDGGTFTLASKVGWDADFKALRQKFLDAGLKEVAASTSKKIASDELRARSELKCDTPQAEPGCGVQVRFIYQVLRGMPHEVVFAQILLGFELASSDPEHFVGLNLVMPEDWYVPIRDFHAHMTMLDYLHGVYPKVHISLHAGELAMGLVKPEDLTYHIRESVEKGHAERIGHGVSIMMEKDPVGLMKEMAAQNISVEINLTSNDQILDVSGENHPLPIYMKYGVPVHLSTDDQAVARSDMTHEYLRAEDDFKFPYATLKRLARQSLEHSFLPGKSLWASTKGNFKPVAACAGDVAGKASHTCSDFLAESEKAKEQMKLERRFANFEKQF